MRQLLTPFILSVALFFSVKADCQNSGSATISWSPSSSPNLAGYQIVYGTSSGNYTGVVPVSSNSTNVTIYGLVNGVKYYFAALSYDASGDLSSLSPEISGVIGATTAAAAALMTALTSNPGQFSFAVSGITGSPYVVQASTDLVNWVAIQTNYAPFTFTDPNRSQFSQRFYRVVYNSGQ